MGILSYNVLAQGHRESPFFSTVATKLTFLKKVLNYFYKNTQNFKMNQFFKSQTLLAFAVFTLTMDFFTQEKIYDGKPISILFTMLYGLSQRSISKLISINVPS